MDGYQGNSGPVAQARGQAVTECVAKIRDIEDAKGVTREALEDIKAVLLDLAARTELFPESELSSPKDGSLMYRLSEDDDNRFALYLSTGAPGRSTPPHNHTTWAVIVGLEGEEENRLYQRFDDGSVPEKSDLRQVETFIVEDRTGIAFLPDDVHSIHVIGDKPTRNFHMYGTSVEHLPNRIQFDLENGTHKVMPANPTIVK